MNVVAAWPRMARRGLLTLVISALVALGLSLLVPLPLRETLVYAVCVSFGCWLLIDGGRLLTARWVHRRCAPDEAAARPQWPGWGWMSVVLALGSVAGYGLGHTLAAALLGHPLSLSTSMGLRALAGFLLLSLGIGLAATYFFYSRGRLATSLAAAEQAQRLATEQRLKLLASQLEPHMLFNTLANLRVLIGTDPPRAQAMLDRLIEFLRATLDGSRQGTHTLGDEFERLTDYLELMQIRMGARLQSRLHLPPELAARQVPALLLQPLVENAIKHGLEPLARGGRLVVSADEQGDGLVLRVRDTGSGLGAANALNDVPGGGFGLAQVRERLAVLYGGRAALDLGPAPDAEGGTLVTLKIPL